MFFMSYSLRPPGKSDSRDGSGLDKDVIGILFGELHPVAPVQFRGFARPLSTKPPFEHAQIAHCP